MATLQVRTYFQSQSDTVTRQGRAHSEWMSDPVVTLMGGGGVEQEEETASAQVVVKLDEGLFVDSSRNSLYCRW